MTDLFTLACAIQIDPPFITTVIKSKSKERSKINSINMYINIQFENGN